MMLLVRLSNLGVMLSGAQASVKDAQRVDEACGDKCFVCTSHMLIACARSAQHDTSNYRRAFTTIELIIVLTIFVVTVAATLPFAGRFLTASTLNTVEQDVVQILRRAQHRSAVGERDSAWGVKFDSNGYTLYAGSSYAGRRATFDEVRTIEGSYTFSGASEITFAKYKGSADVSGTVVVAHPEAGSISISVNEGGGISVQ